MKRTSRLFLSIILIIAMFMVGCGNSGKTKDDNKANIETEVSERTESGTEENMTEENHSEVEESTETETESETESETETESESETEIKKPVPETEKEDVNSEKPVTKPDSGTTKPEGSTNNGSTNQNNTTKPDGNTKPEEEENKGTFISTLGYSNTGKMGDVDGPAFATYSKVGYNAASAVLDVKNMEINTLLPNGKFVNGYAFMGIDVYYDNNGRSWQNCVDAGLCWSGPRGGWHLFYNVYEPLNANTPTWYESRVILPKDDVYTMTFTLVEDNYALLTVEGNNTGVKDEVRVEVKGANADGSNTSFLFNAALDYPPNTKVDRYGNLCEDFIEITLANSDKGIFLRSFHVKELTLYKNDTAVDWTNDKCSAISIWPDQKIKGFDYSPTVVEIFDGTEYIINLDMNR